MAQKDYGEIKGQIKESMREMREMLEARLPVVEADPRFVAIKGKIDNVCQRLIDLGRRTEGELADENGPFSALHAEVEALVRECYDITSDLLMKGERWTPRAEEDVPVFVTTHVFTKEKFPFITVSPRFENDQNGIRRFYEMNVELDADALIEAIDKE